MNLAGVVTSGLGGGAAGTTSNESRSLSSSLDEVLGKDAFLKLLTTQLRYQDPTNPVDDRDLLAQMAQFSALEQMHNLTLTIERFLQANEKSALLAQAVALLGRTVEVAGASGETYIGRVDAVRMVDGVPRLVVGGTLFEPGDVFHILSDAGA